MASESKTFTATKPNLLTILAAVEQLRGQGIVISDEAVRQGVMRVCDLTGLMGRWQTICTQPTVICDIGHNSHGIAIVANQLKELGKPLHIVFGMLRDKDVERSLSLMPTNATYYFTAPDSHRAMPATEIMRLAQN